MRKTREEEDAEVPEGSTVAGVNIHIEETNKDKWNDVFQVILVIPAEHNYDTFYNEF